MSGLHDYYLTQAIRPTHADFRNDTELTNYAALRKSVFWRLNFLPDLFSGKRVLEFGPDTGENSLIFAQWGAHLTLVEPNENAHSFIHGYFSKFHLEDRLDDVVGASILEFSSQHKFDIIDAEGFIYTVQPTRAWIDKTAQLLKKDGFLIVSFTTPHGGFIELLTKAIYRRVANDPKYGAGIETAKRLFLPRWNSIPHTRKLESWFMDVIENPFVRMKYFIDPSELLREAHEGGFRLYSSWPNYRDVLEMHWIKSPLDNDRELRASTSFVEQNRLGHLLGCKCFVPEITSRQLERVDQLTQITDELIDKWSNGACSTAAACVHDIEDLIKNKNTALGDENTATATKVLAMCQTLFQLMGMDDVDQLVEFCRQDETFISTWGMPNHYAIFQRTQ